MDDQDLDRLKRHFPTRDEYESHAHWIAQLQTQVQKLTVLVEQMPSAESILALRREVSEVHRNYQKMEELVSRQAELAQESVETSRRLLEGWKAVGTLLGALK